MNSITSGYAFLRCFHPVFSVRGSRRGSKHDPRFLFAAGRMPSYNKVALSYNKATFLTEYAELGKMRSGAARTAGGYGYTPAKGGVAYADYVTYRTVHRDDYRKKQKPPLWQVTVSMGFAHKPIYSLGS